MKANVLYIESPGKVGFSSGLRHDNNSDETVAEDNLKALIDFFNKFDKDGSMSVTRDEFHEGIKVNSF